jgi:predicted RNA-binding protein YlqC (UPF0109 family)
MKHLLEFILNRLVKFPEDLKVEENIDEDFTIFTISANDEDYGRIIGKKGNMINALSHIIKAKASMENKKISIKIKQEETK